MTDTPELPHDIVNTRVLPASPETLFQAYRDPAALAKWWGPKGFTNVFQEFDFRPGGVWKFIMKSPDGAEYPNHKEFTEIVENERITLTHQQPVHWFTLWMALAPEGEGACRLTWRMRFREPEEAAKLRDFILTANEENLDRLEAYIRGA